MDFFSFNFFKTFGTTAFSVKGHSDLLSHTFFFGSIASWQFSYSSGSPSKSWEMFVWVFLLSVIYPQCSHSKPLSISYKCWMYAFLSSQSGQQHSVLQTSIFSSLLHTSRNFLKWFTAHDFTCEIIEVKSIPNTCWHCIDYIIFAKFLSRFFLQTCCSGQSGILCHLLNLQPSQHVHKVSLTPARLHVSVCSTWAFVALVFGAWALQSGIVLYVSTWAFAAWVFGGWSFCWYCQGVISKAW